ncbi:MAG: hypothetical protein A3B74_03195 [Candidatus Kerfeldbacteria bacterium RIFCSPHIGHO2_02_FULL_42_14]|uniref:DUF4956 domain-containing protein n=1 Tax=Candidatus Kerfeldbacteria bacterium RIFCSPHIGHO2_02_FULL_42_14 TaxID=1798540 RepID=A0A1G2AQD6_9BACT|nr:MAG: hypothetical protein A3B74_03195 [Candidatus Kerfeldbacteria bacterium RIFCSPHIGHO2_02_FULL_42_14]OGY80914.1 MAG: hypothetical protein A3E60_03110 [Candidatus Kerfeldbacteria bacterium RIFCSPHIGHO2_12_FULL_42_13]OGY84147.1 MAG: hypothetical protein A3I91_01510 [Candidatus Kerfeldbacteria bacterium RIFCSPLOWO2_02_FULL_42_19]OGY87277.1 MAG: hypothetical protein A3G01_02980 [Candidatus Kerfeldbacteria bacterium RIFCSPLOWO2_12_FULL_43_9]
MPTSDTLQQFFMTSGNIAPLRFFVYLLAVALLCFLLGKVYIRFGRALSNRVAFAHNFVLIGLATLLIISVVKSSLALSLGLVGALSIVRFRAAIKEPEELAYLFFVIAIGLGFGADQWLITLFAFVVIILLLIARGQYKRSEQPHLSLAIHTSRSKPDSLQRITEILQKHTTMLSLRRFDESQQGLEALFFVGFSDFAHVESLKRALQAFDASLQVTFLDHQGLLS